MNPIEKMKMQKEREERRAAQREARKLPQPYESYKDIITSILAWLLVYMITGWALLMVSVFMVVKWL